MPSTPSIASTLRDWRRRWQLSQTAAAVALGVPLATLRNWEQARRLPRGLALEALRAKLQSEPAS